MNDWTAEWAVSCFAFTLVAGMGVFEFCVFGLEDDEYAQKIPSSLSLFADLGVGVEEAWDFVYKGLKGLLLCGGRATKRSVFLVFVLVFLTAFCAIMIQPVRASADSWMSKAPMPSANAGGGAVVVNGEIYVVGSNFTYVYDPSANVWVSKAPLPTHQQSFAKLKLLFLRSMR
jgi:hypothetical protein